jgi:hypothetical protein
MDLLPEYHGGILSTEDMEEVRLHLEECRDCRETVELFAAMDSTVPEPPAAFWASLPARVTEESQAGVGLPRETPIGSRWARFPAWVGGVAAVAAAALLITISFPVTKIVENGVNTLDGTYGQGTFISTSLEEEILALSGYETALPGTVISEMAFLDETYGKEMVFSLELNEKDPFDSLFGAESMEIMDGETIRLFERMIIEMLPEQTERG